MKVLHVAESIKGGVGTYLCIIRPAQAAEAGIESTRFLVPSQHRELVKSIPPEELRYFERRRRGVLSIWSLGTCLIRLVRDYDPAIIHAHSTFAGLLVRILNGVAFRRRLVVYCPHGWAMEAARSTILRNAIAATELVMSFFSDRIVAVSSHEISEGLRVGIRSGKLKLVRNGVPDVEVSVAAKWEHIGLKVLFVGRLDRQKGYDRVLELARELGNEVHFRVVGESVVEDESIASDMPNLLHLGWLDPASLDQQMRAADLVLVPSRWEGFGLVAVEAMRAGKAVVASKTGGLKEIVRHGETGILLEPCEAEDIARTLRNLPLSLLASFGAAGRQRYEEAFRSDEMNRALIETYREL